jgi:hypothetical protein
VLRYAEQSIAAFAQIQIEQALDQAPAECQQCPKRQEPCLGVVSATGIPCNQSLSQCHHQGSLLRCDHITRQLLDRLNKHKSCTIDKAEVALAH